MNHYEIINQFRAAMLDAGVIYNGEILPDGKLHRIHVEGDRSGTQNGAYTLHLDKVPAGYFEYFKLGVRQTWRADGKAGRLSKADFIAIQEARRQRAEEQARLNRLAANKARYLWNASLKTAVHPYLIKKRIKAHGARTAKTGALIIPLYDDRLNLVNVQLINADGIKRFLSGGKKKGCFWWLGDSTDTVLIAEGFATAATLHEQTGKQVFIAFDAGNLDPVTKIVRAKLPDVEIIIGGDNDESGKGQQCARAAAIAVNGKVLIPPRVGEDWNDHFCRELGKSSPKFPEKPEINTSPFEHFGATKGK